jgi:hypothetical protein
MDTSSRQFLIDGKYKDIRMTARRQRIAMGSTNHHQPLGNSASCPETMSTGRSSVRNAIQSARGEVSATTRKSFLTAVQSKQRRDKTDFRNDQILMRMFRQEDTKSAGKLPPSQLVHMLNKQLGVDRKTVEGVVGACGRSETGRVDYSKLCNRLGLRQQDTSNNGKQYDPFTDNQNGVRKEEIAFLQRTKKVASKANHAPPPVPALENPLSMTDFTSRTQYESALFKPAADPSARAVAQKEWMGSDDIEWVISPKASLTARSGFLTGAQAEAAWRPQALQKKLLREKMQHGMNGGQASGRNQGEGGHYKYMGTHDLPQELSEEAKEKKARLAAKHKQKSEHEARIMARALSEEEAKGTREQARIIAKSKQLAKHVDSAHQREDLNEVIINGKRRTNDNARVRNFTTSNDNHTLATGRAQETGRGGYTQRTGTATARFLGGGSHQQRNGSALGGLMNDF